MPSLSQIATVGGEVPRDQQETLDEGLEGAYYFKLHLHALDSGVGDVIPLSVSGGFHMYMPIYLSAY